MIIYFKKKLGETILEAVERFKKENEEYRNEKIGCAGRLDPMALGELMLLSRESLKNQEILQNHKKIYECKIILGFKTDTLDILGYIEDKEENINPKSIERVKEVIEKIKGGNNIFELEYPNYSALRINGKPLWWYSKNKLLDRVKDKIKKQKTEIYDIEILEIESINYKELYKKILEKINTLSTKSKKDFRYSEIEKRYEIINNDEETYIIKIRADVSSGSYIRSIVKKIGEMSGIYTTVMDINRIKIYK